MIVKSILLIFSIPMIAFASTSSTKVNVMSDPSVRQLNTAIRTLNEAIAAKEKGNIKKFKSKLAKAKKYQEQKKVQREYNAAFIIQRPSGRLVNYFDALQVSSELRYETLIDESCFRGNIKAANAILSHMISDQVLNYDEEWFTKNRIKNSSTILIDFVDGPNDLRETRKIRSCEL